MGKFHGICLVRIKFHMKLKVLHVKRTKYRKTNINRKESVNSHLVINWFTLREGCPSNMDKLLIENKRMKEKRGYVSARASIYEYI